MGSLFKSLWALIAYAVGVLVAAAAGSVGIMLLEAVVNEGPLSIEAARDVFGYAVLVAAIGGGIALLFVEANLRGTGSINQYAWAGSFAGLLVMVSVAVYMGGLLTSAVCVPAGWFGGLAYGLVRGRPPFVRAS